MPDQQTTAAQAGAAGVVRKMEPDCSTEVAAAPLKPHQPMSANGMFHKYRILLPNIFIQIGGMTFWLIMLKY